MENYIERRNDVYYLRETGITLDLIVTRFHEGLTPETIQSECFPQLTLEQIYGAIAYYLRHKTKINEYLQRAAVEFAEASRQAKIAHPPLAERNAARRFEFELIDLLHKYKMEPQRHRDTETREK